jgi:hypothetical protein
MGGPGGGMGGPGGGMGGPGGGEVPKPPRAPLDPEAEREKRRELRARIDAIQTELETSQREPATAALAELLPDQQAAAEAIIADFFASLQAPAVPPGGPGGPRGPGGRIEGEPVEGVPVP